MVFDYSKLKTIAKFFLRALSVPVWDMIISTTMVAAAFVGGFFSSGTRNFIFMFPQYSMKFHLMYKTTATETLYFFPGVTKYFAIWLFWGLISCVFAVLSRKLKPFTVVVLSAVFAMVIKISIYAIVVVSNHAIPLDGL